MVKPFCYSFNFPPFIKIDSFLIQYNPIKISLPPPIPIPSNVPSYEDPVDFCLSLENHEFSARKLNKI